MYFAHLNYLRLVIEHGSFASAARAAGVSQPAISYAMKQLQQQFSVPLLIRAGRRYVPSDMALHIASEAASLAQRMDALTTMPQQEPRDRNVLRVGLTPSSALVCGPVLYESWCAEHSHRLLELTSADEGSLLAGLSRNEFDLVVSPKPRGPVPGGIACQRLYQLQPLIYARREHPCIGAQTLEELVGMAWVSVGPNVRGPVDMLTEAYVARKMTPPRVAVSCPDYPSMLNLVANSNLLGVVPHPLLLGIAQKNVFAMHLREALPLYEVWVFSSPSSRKRMKTVIEHLAKCCAPVGDR